MAVYAINLEGVEAMQTLRSELQQAIDDILQSCVKLENTVNSLEGQLGIYHEIILLEIKKVLLIVKKAKDGDDGVEFLINNKIPSMIANMEMLIEAGLGDGDDNPQKVLTLRR